MNNLFDALEICLQEVESGKDIESVLSHYPDLADELRPILKTALKARKMSAPEPALEVVQRGRARVLQHAAELREMRSAPRRRGISVFQRLALSFALLLFLLVSGTGILSASASALPGERLYPVKRGWEKVRLFFIFDSEARELLADEFENERLHEVNELLSQGRLETIQFAGVFMQVNSKYYVSGVQVLLPANISAPQNGVPVIVSGRTNSQGFIEVTSIELLPAGSVVPSGAPIELETLPRATSAAPSEGEATSTPAFITLQGTLQSISSTMLVINNMSVYLHNAQINGQLCIGVSVTVNGYYAVDGTFIAIEVTAIGSCERTPSGSNSNSNNNLNENEGNAPSEDNENNSNDDDDDDNGGNNNEDDGGEDNEDDDDDNGGGDDND